MTLEDAIAELMSMGALGTQALDEAVHDKKADEAAGINNEGVRAQVEYLGLDMVKEMLGSLRDEQEALRESRDPS